MAFFIDEMVRENFAPTLTANTFEVTGPVARSVSFQVAEREDGTPVQPGDQTWVHFKGTDGSFLVAGVVYNEDATRTLQVLSIEQTSDPQGGIPTFVGGGEVFVTRGVHVPTIGTDGELHYAAPLLTAIRKLARLGASKQILPNGDATPDLSGFLAAGTRQFQVAATPPAAITDFDGVTNDEEFILYPNAAPQVLTHSDGIFDLGGQDLTLSPGDSPLYFVAADGVISLVGGGARAASQPIVTVAQLLADDGTLFSLAAGNGQTKVEVGDTIYARHDHVELAYKVVASGGDVTTAGGLELDVEPIGGRIHLAAWGIDVVKSEGEIAGATVETAKVNAAAAKAVSLNMGVYRAGWGDRTLALPEGFVVIEPDGIEIVSSIGLRIEPAGNGYSCGFIVKGNNKRANVTPTWDPAVDTVGVSAHGYENGQPMHVVAGGAGLKMHDIVFVGSKTDNTFTLHQSKRLAMDDPSTGKINLTDMTPTVDLGANTVTFPAGHKLRTGEQVYVSGGTDFTPGLHFVRGTGNTFTLHNSYGDAILGANTIDITVADVTFGLLLRPLSTVFRFATYIDVTIDPAVMFVQDGAFAERNDHVNRPQRDYSTILFELDGDGGGQEFRWRNGGYTVGFHTILLHPNDVDGDRTRVRETQHIGCYQVVYARSTQSVENSFDRITFAGCLEYVFNIGGFGYTTIKECTDISTATFMKIADGFGGDAQTIKMQDIKQEWDTGHEAYVPRLIDWGVEAEKEVVMRNCTLSGGVKPASGAIVGRIEPKWGKGSIEGGHTDGDWIFRGEVVRRPREAAGFEMKKHRTGRIEDWIIEDAVAPILPLRLEDVEQGAGSLPVTLSWSGNTAGRLAVRKVRETLPLLEADAFDASYGSGGNHDLSPLPMFPGQKAVLHAFSLYQEGNTGATGTIDLYETADDRTNEVNRIAQITVVGDAANPSWIESDLAGPIVVTGLYAKVDNATQSLLGNVFVDIAWM